MGLARSGHDIFHDSEPWRMAGGQKSKKTQLWQNKETFDFAVFRKRNEGFHWKSIKIVKKVLKSLKKVKK